MRIYQIFTALCIMISYAAPLSDFAQKQLLLPPPPKVSSEAYVVLDTATGTIIAEKNPDKELYPASLTKLMTTYVIFHALAQGHLHLEDLIHVSTNAWRTGGTRLFLNENSNVDLETILRGIIIVSGNDACVAVSESFAGSESNFAIIMNRYAERLKLKHTHFMNATGIHNTEHFTSAMDLAKLSSHIIQDFPQYFHWFHEKNMTYNGIAQGNRNNLMAKHPEIDGLKTGYTDPAGFCFSTTAQKDNTRLVVVTMNAPSLNARNQDALALLNYGFRFYETTLLYPKNTVITSLPVYLGLLNTTDVIVKDAFWATIPKGSKNHLRIEVKVNEPLSAPLHQNESVGTILAIVDDEVVSQAPLYPAKDIQSSKGVSYQLSYTKRLFKTWTI